MIFVNGKNTLGDIQRLLRWIIPMAFSMAFGFLLCYYIYVKGTVLTCTNTDRYIYISTAGLTTLPITGPFIP